MIPSGRSIWGAFGLALAVAALALPVTAQPTPAYRTETVFYRNAEDSAYLTASLTLPSGAGPHAGVVLLSIAGTQPLVDRLAGQGYAVLLPTRRGFVEVEPLLRATYQDLAGDARAAVDYLRSRADVDDARLGLIGQGDDSPPAMLAAAGLPQPIPLVLLAPPGFPGREVFRLEQRAIAENDGRTRQELTALDRYLEEIVDVVLSESAPLRTGRLQLLMARSSVQLPYNAGFPSDERQAHFFASALWHDRIAFDPEKALAALRSPVLVLIGSEDPNTPLIPYLTAVRRGLSAPGTRDATLCLMLGRTRHTFSDDTVEAITEWLGDRVMSASAPPTAAPRGCQPDPSGR